MAALLQFQPPTDMSYYMEQLYIPLASNPEFSSLQQTLLSDCCCHSVPYTLFLLASDDDTVSNISPGTPSNSNSITFAGTSDDDLEREQRMLLDDFRVLFSYCQDQGQSDASSSQIERLQTLGQELHDFYRTHTTYNALCSSQQQRQAVDTSTCAVSAYHARQERHLVSRVHRSLCLLLQSVSNMASDSAANTGTASDPSSNNASVARAGDENKMAAKKKSRLLPCKSVALLNDWYQRHEHNPYPTDKDKTQLASAAGLTHAQVKAWFANKRNRSLNTKPKRHQQLLTAQLAASLHHFAPVSIDTSDSSVPFNQRSRPIISL